MRRSDRILVLQRRIRILLYGFVIGLVLSGVTAFPLPQELVLACRWLGLPETGGAANYSGLAGWLLQVREGVLETNARYPFIFYGTDWLAFGHLVIALVFVGPIKDPVRNAWVVRWAMLACVLVVPLALICGPIRGIPFFWRLIDCSFGIVGIVPLYACERAIRELEK